MDWSLMVVDLGEVSCHSHNPGERGANMKNMRLLFSEIVFYASYMEISRIAEWKCWASFDWAWKEGIFFKVIVSKDLRQHERDPFKK